jgi:hypothetical protein
MANYFCLYCSRINILSQTHAFISCSTISIVSQSKNDKVGGTGTTRAVNNDEHHLIGAVKKRNKAFTKVVRKGLGWRRTEVSDESLA